MIEPTVGRVVWYYPNERDLHGRSEAPMIQYGDKPLAAQVVAVHGNRSVNLLVSDAEGRQFPRQHVQLLQDDGQDVPVDKEPYCTWMPYQKGQAAKAEDKVGRPEPDHSYLRIQALEMALRTPGLSGYDGVLAAAAAYQAHMNGATKPEAAQPAQNDHSTIDLIARVCHEVNRAYCQALGDNSQPYWEDAPAWQRESARMGVDLHMMGDFGPEASHIAWMQQKLDEGWRWGSVKDPENKKHPCLVPFDQLPREQQAKDFIFRAIVHALR